MFSYIDKTLFCFIASSILAVTSVNASSISNDWGTTTVVGFSDNSKNGYMLEIVATDATNIEIKPAQEIKNHPLNTAYAIRHPNPQVGVLYVSGMKSSPGLALYNIVEKNNSFNIELQKVYLDEGDGKFSGQENLSFDKDAQHMFSASYRDGRVASYTLGIDGVPAFVKDSVFTAIDGAHGAYLSPQNLVFVPVAKKDNSNIYMYAFDQATGKLSESGKLDDTLDLKDKGPRHAAMSLVESRPFVYFSNEWGLNASAYAMTESGLTSINTTKALLTPQEVADLKDKYITTSDVKITSDGVNVYMGLRAKAKSKVIHYQAQDDGSLVLKKEYDSPSTPWAIELVNGDKVLLVTFRDGGKNKVIAYSIADDGGLVKSAEGSWGKDIRSIMPIGFLPKSE